MRRPPSAYLRPARAGSRGAYCGRPPAERNWH